MSTLITVPAHDARIVYTGPPAEWKDDIFELRGIDPSGGGVNSTFDVCVLGATSRETFRVGNGFSFSFTGTSVHLIMESRQDHGLVQFTLDSQPSTTISGYSDAPHCGALFTASGLDGSKTHVVSATLSAPDPASTWSDTYMKLFAVQYDPGNSSSTPLHDYASASKSGNPKPTDVPVLRAEQSFSTGAIIGVTVASFLLALALFFLGVWLFIRWRRTHRQPKFKRIPEDHLDGTEKPKKVQRERVNRPRTILSGADDGEPVPFLSYGAEQGGVNTSASGSRSATPVPSPRSATTTSHTPRPSFSSTSSGAYKPTSYVVLASGPRADLGKSHRDFDEEFTSSHPSDQDDLPPPY
ncbi:hypothetical protein EXIGLDRAFT_841540 [Exidia glandulosa HHB12029]|uniref:Uncharacterized protein n=1 Tax=Exidia glandulosa HHB12029 TaxID=1314781 RepID=A0A165DU02_EXIGL|nr:hypothetical protein EXIGLDRAFT_841540 [Exidia glandulosa HHB12029]